MYRRGMTPQYSRALALALAGAIDANPAAPAIPATAQVRLIKAPVSLGIDVPLANLTAVEADFTNYAPVTLPAAIDGVQLAAQVQGCIWVGMNFAPAAPVTVPNTLFGYYVTNNANNEWFLAELFDQTVNILNQWDFLNLDIAAGVFCLLSFT